jgi:toxin ParE1/3/4
MASTYDLLLMFPHAGRSRDELREGLRSLPVGNHVIFDQDIEDRTEVVRVLHGPQDVQGVLLHGDDREDGAPAE